VQSIRLIDKAADVGAPGTGTATGHRVRRRVVCIHPLLEELGNVPTGNTPRAMNLCACDASPNTTAFIAISAFRPRSTRFAGIHGFALDHFDQPR